MLTTQIKSEMTAAMKARDALRVETLRGAMAAFTNELVAKGRKPTEELTDQEAVAVLKRLAKQRKESAEAFTGAGRAELAEKELGELKIIETYLPASVSREEIERVAKAKKEELGVTDAAGAGKLMGAVIKEFGGNADGAVVKEVVTGLFS
ncbi:GatB/YqeY domain-containing protein [Candidatus Kaiserbacteria bacterium]|nr:GatB/YqeY domain-containing protein [Candidatus Kaiserbacteria bacterium]